VRALWEGSRQSIDTVITSGSAPPRIVNIKVLSSAYWEECSAVVTDITERIQAKNGKRKTRLGLLGMRERVEMIGGVIQVESAPGEPTTIRVELPAEKGGKRKSRKKG
jgi:signal transduction histidine kinase